MDSLPQEANLPPAPAASKKWPAILAILILIIALVSIGFFYLDKKSRDTGEDSSGELLAPDYDLTRPEIVGQRLAGLAILTEEQSEDIRSNFESDWVTADTERKKWGSYRNLYFQLWAVHNVTKDPGVKTEMDQIEQFLAQTWPDFYKATENDPNAWITE